LRTITDGLRIEEANLELLTETDGDEPTRVVVNEPTRRISMERETELVRTARRHPATIALIQEITAQVEAGVVVRMAVLYEVLGLGNRAMQIPSVLYLRPEGGFLVGEAAEARSAAEPDRIVREFKRRIGDPVPILVAGSPFSAEVLTARLLSYVVGVAAERQGGPPDSITVAHPANWGSYKMDLLRQATQNLMATAQAAANSTNAHYRAAIYTFNIGFNTITSLTSSLSAAQSQASNIDVYEVPYQNWSNDAITNYTNAMNRINSVMPNPGSGTNQAGDSPQEVMFFVTDGVEDQMTGGSRVQSLMDPSYCTTIKNRGIRIAVLYTTYLPLPTNAWYNRYIGPFQPNIGPTLQSCASPGLYFQVSTDQDISAAMVALFNKAVATAHLTR